MDVEVGETERLLEKAVGGDAASWGALLAEHAPRLARLISARIDPRMKGRIDADDLLQEICLEAWRCLPNFTEQSLPFYVWLRGLAGNKLLELHRHHLGTQKRDARRERNGAVSSDASSVLLVSLLTDTATSASAAARREELKAQLHGALEQMEAIDREVLVLRHFEQLSPTETAAVLGIKEKAAGMRYVRAVKRLGHVLNQLPGGLEALRP